MSLGNLHGANYWLIAALIVCGIFWLGVAALVSLFI